VGFVDMMQIVQFMLAEFKSAFKLPVTDAQAIQVRGGHNMSFLHLYLPL
jgi:hypothetical protein